MRVSPSKPELRVHIRWMIRRDMPTVLAIENRCFEYPWSERDFQLCLRGRNSIGMVAVHSDQVDGDWLVGFMIYELLDLGYDLLNLAVAPAFQRQGVGSQMVRKMIGKLSQHRRVFISVEVRETNLPAQLFFRSHGFRAVRVLRHQYQETNEDAYRMEYEI